MYFGVQMKANFTVSPSPSFLTNIYILPTMYLTRILMTSLGFFLQVPSLFISLSQLEALSLN